MISIIKVISINIDSIIILLVIYMILLITIIIENINFVIIIISIIIAAITNSIIPAAQQVHVVCWRGKHVVCLSRGT